MKVPKATSDKPSAPRAETLLEKTTRMAQGIIEDDVERRRLKTARLRKARLEKEAGTSAEAAKASSNGARKKSRGKAGIKR